jgi:aspartyl-tRNA(Asn)/glutamyl-tRNA(Gln) amidotransferase subunit C
MSVDQATVRRIAHLARIALNEGDVAPMAEELNAILRFVEELNEVDVAGVEPMISVTPMTMSLRPDVVTDGGNVAAILSNAPQSTDGFFVVPKVVE